RETIARVKVSSNHRLWCERKGNRSAAAIAVAATTSAMRAPRSDIGIRWTRTGSLEATATTPASQRSRTGCETVRERAPGDRLGRTPKYAVALRTPNNASRPVRMSAMGGEHVLYGVSDGVATITLNDPETRNSLSVEMLLGLH